MIKLIALDMDGTVLNRDGNLSLKNKDAIKRAISKDIIVVIASGRSLAALPQSVLSIDGIRYAITANGANVVDLKDECSIYVNHIDKETIKTLTVMLKDERYIVEFFVKGRAYIERNIYDSLSCKGMPKEYLKIVKNSRYPTENLFDFVQQNDVGVESINVNFADMQLKAGLYKKLVLNKDISVTSSFSYNLEIGNSTVSKASGLGVLLEFLNVKAKTVLACGDSDNDKSLMDFVGISVAMGNAEESVKAAADYIVADCDNDGVAEAIERFVIPDS